MSDSEEAILRRIARENQEARARFAGLTARTSSAVVAGDWDALNAIVKEASNDGNNSGNGTDGEPAPTGVDAAQGPESSPQ